MHSCEFTATDKYYTNGVGPKLRGWTNGGMQDHQSTLSRPRSAEVITANGNGTLPNGRHMNGVLTRGPGGLHEDLEFPPTPRTLSKKKQIVWMRPHDMCARPQFRIAPPGTPLTARELPEPVGPGDPSLLAALGCLSQLPRLLERVVPPEQTFDTANGYCGMFKFRFWQWGKWIEVRVDDRLPTRGDRPAHMHCAQPDIFWAALLEKAYAKLYGGYTFLKYGTVGRALQDLTGAVVQSVPPSGPLLGGAVPRSTLLIAISGLEKETKRRRSGLLTEHPYCVTGLARVRANSNDSVTHSGSGSSGGDTSLIRLRSPWIGGEWGGVWCGAWSERSWEWNALNERDRELLSSRSSNDCEFWMSVNEFLTRFVVIWLAHIGPDDWALEPGLHTRAPWRAALAVRQWRAGFNAGGPHKFIETTATNPQFRIRVPPGHPSKAHVVVAVAQKYECYRSRNYEDEEIGFTIYEVPPGMQRVTPQYVSEQMPLDFAPLSNLREIATFFALPAGDFVVMPHAAQHREGRFLLRIFADQHTDVWEVNEENLVIHNIAAEFCDERTIDARILYKLRARYPHEIDATQLQAILKAHGGNNRGFRGLGGINCGPSLELCRGMLALRDPALGGRLSIEHVPALIGLMRFWKAAFRRCGPSSSGTATLSRGIWASKVSSYCLRGLLWAGGATASNKVLEALVSRFTRSRQITLEGYLLSMARLHLAHERYHSLDAKAKASPLSLEEMILMTIYSSTIATTFVESAQQAGYPYRDYNAGDQIGVSFLQANTLQGRRVTSGNAYLYPARKRPNLHILTRAWVTKVLINKDINFSNFIQYLKGRGVFTTNSVESLMYVKSPVAASPDPGLPDVEVMQAFSSIDYDTGTGTPRAFRLTNTTFEGYFRPIMNVRSFQYLPMLLKPYTRGKLRLKSTNPFHHPVFQYRYFEDDRDIEALVYGVVQPSLSLISLGNITSLIYDAKEINYGRHTLLDSYDFIIVGAGPAGCVLANRLSEDPSVTVLLLDIGRGEIPLFTDSPLIGPILATDIARAFVKSAEQAGYRYLDYNAGDNLGVSFLQAHTRNGRRATGGNSYLRDIVDRPNLHIVTRAWVTKILIDPGKTSMEHILNARREFLRFRNGSGPLTSNSVESLLYVKSPFAEDPDPEYPDVEVMQAFASFSIDTTPGTRNAYYLTDRMFNEYFRPLANTRNFMFLPMLLKPRAVGRVELKSVNPFSHPAFRYQYFEDDRDVDAVVYAIKEVIRISTKAPLRKFGIELYNRKVPGCQYMPFNTIDYWRCHVRHLTATFQHQGSRCNDVLEPSEPSKLWLEVSYLFAESAHYLGYEFIDPFLHASSTALGVEVSINFETHYLFAKELIIAGRCLEDYQLLSKADILARDTLSKLLDEVPLEIALKSPIIAPIFTLNGSPMIGPTPPNEQPYCLLATELFIETLSKSGTDQTLTSKQGIQPNAKVNIVLKEQAAQRWIGFNPSVIYQESATELSDPATILKVLADTIEVCMKLSTSQTFQKLGLSLQPHQIPDAAASACPPSQTDSVLCFVNYTLSTVYNSVERIFSPRKVIREYTTRIGILSPDQTQLNGFSMDALLEKLRDRLKVIGNELSRRPTLPLDHS
uniref:Uncharacterized protein n=1 Tax=Anopheles stephensi TaxID=30069 RepID=A0A182Y1U9_ANOST